MTRAPWVLPKPTRAFPAGDVTAVSTTLGWRLVNQRMPAEWTVSLGEANEQLRRAVRHLAASGRTRSPPAPTDLADAAWSDGFYDDLVVAGRRRRPGPRRGHPARLHRREAGRPEAVVPPGRHDHRRQRLAAQRRRLRGAARLRGRRGDAIGVDPLARIAGRGAARAGAAGLRLSRRSRPPTGRSPGPASAGPTSARSSSTRRSRCSRWPASTPGRSTPRSSTPRAARSRSATRSAPPAAGSSARSRTGSRESGERWGVAAICIGVGQGLAVVLENVASDRR